MSATMMIDPSGKVIRLHHLKKQPSFISSFSDDSSFRHLSTRQSENNKNSKRPTKSSASMEKPIGSTRQRNQKSTAGLNKEEESLASSHPSDNDFKSVSSKGPQDSALKGLEEHQPAPPLSCTRRNPLSKNRPWNNNERLLLSRDDSHRTTSTFQSLGSHSASMMLDKHAFMSYRFPITTTTQKMILRKRRPKSRGISIENDHGKTIGFVDYTSLTKTRGTRILKDATGRTCAIIQQKKGDSMGFPSVIFRVYGDKPCRFGQEPISNDEMVKGCYLRAEIKNVGTIGGKFVMKRRSTSHDHQRYSAKRFGSLFSKSKSKGFIFLDSEEEECAKMISLKDPLAKGIVVAPDQDMCLMLAFCAVVDEMVEQRLYEYGDVQSTLR